MKLIIIFALLFVNGSIALEVETSHSVSFSSDLKIAFSDEHDRYVETEPTIIEAFAVFKRLNSRGTGIYQKKFYF